MPPTPLIERAVAEFQKLFYVKESSGIFSKVMDQKLTDWLRSTLTRIAEEARNEAIKQSDEHYKDLVENLRCNKGIPDGSSETMAVCGVKLDCHLHDWRQKEHAQDLLSELKRAVEEMKETSKISHFVGENHVKRTCDICGWNSALDSVLNLIEKKK